MRLVSTYFKDFYPFQALPFIDDLVFTNDPSELKKGDVLVVWGGQDISPSLYNKKVSKYTGADEKPSRRDEVEWNMMQGAKSIDIPIIGVCRGAQMLCALAGGHLIQHIDHHGGTHKVLTIDGQEIRTNSIHHQMMYPWNVKHEMLMWSKDKLSGVYIDEDKDVEVPCEPEFVHFPEVKGFAIQFHPEMMDDKSEATQYVFKAIEERIHGR